MVIHENLRKKKIFRAICFTIYAPKCVIFVKFISQNISKNIEMLCQCEYASPDNLWQLMGTAYECMTVSTYYTGIRSQKVFYDKFGLNWRQCSRF